MSEFPLVDDACTCPVCSSDLAGIVPCQRAQFNIRGVPSAMGQAGRGDCDPSLPAGSAGFDGGGQ